MECLCRCGWTCAHSSTHKELCTSCEPFSIELHSLWSLSALLHGYLQREHVVTVLPALELADVYPEAAVWKGAIKSLISDSVWSLRLCWKSLDSANMSPLLFLMHTKP